MFRPLPLAAFLLALITAPSFAQTPPPSSSSLTPEALLSLRHLSDLEYSPDGTRVAFVVTEPPKGDQRPRHIWLFEPATRSFRQLTYSEKTESLPKWSPDGKSLAFLSNRDANQQIYLLSMAVGESEPLTRGKRNVSRFEWSDDGKQIAFIAPDAKSEAEEKKEKDKDDARVEDKDEKQPRLWLLDVATKSERALTPPNYAVSELAWFPDHQSLAIVATDHPESDRNTDRIFRVQTVSATDPKTLPAPKELLAPTGPFNGIQIAPSGNTISFIGSRQDGPSPHDVWLLPVGLAAAKNLTATSLDRAVFAQRWKKDGSLLLLAADRFTRKLVRYTPSGAREDVALPDTMPSSFALNSQGDLALVGENSTQPQEIWFAAAGQQPTEIQNFNKFFNASTLLKPEIYKYKSFDGLEIEAALLKPANYDGKSKLPLVALIHGGPTGAWESSVETWGQLLVARGYAVFYPNIRGSIGYGQKFVESNRADWGGADFQDVMAGIEDLIAKGVADPNRLGIGGWSYGGYMSEWAITQQTKYTFKAAVSGAGMANLISEYGTEQHPSYDEWFWGVPYEKPDGFLNHSPFLFLKHAKTPTLILQGDADTVDPLGQSQELYRGLKRYGVPTELVVYPREPHGLREEKHLVDRLNRIVAWFDKYLK
ncbi:MAG TPA: S9 family peptidase [Candidatus Acidoferrum sp.]|nr:S9 family peptidase [Candidatus Acidoferrum sp.]